MIVRRTCFRLPADFVPPNRTQSVLDLMNEVPPGRRIPTLVWENLQNHPHNYASQYSEVR